jgi:hypothetical protein
MKKPGATARSGFTGAGYPGAGSTIGAALSFGFSSGRQALLEGAPDRS